MKPSRVSFLISMISFASIWISATLAYRTVKSLPNPACGLNGPLNTRPNAMLESFYRHLKVFAEKRIAACYMKRTGWNLKCPACKTWSAISEIEFLPDAEDGSRRYKCLQCEKITHWHFEGPAAISLLTE